MTHELSIDELLSTFCTTFWNLKEGGARCLQELFMLLIPTRLLIQSLLHTNIQYPKVGLIVCRTYAAHTIKTYYLILTPHKYPVPQCSLWICPMPNVGALWKTQLIHIETCRSISQTLLSPSNWIQVATIYLFCFWWRVSPTPYLEQDHFAGTAQYDYLYSISNQQYHKLFHCLGTSFEAKYSRSVDSKLTPKGFCQAIWNMLFESSKVWLAPLLLVRTIHAYNAYDVGLETKVHPESGQMLLTYHLEWSQSFSWSPLQINHQ